VVAHPLTARADRTKPLVIRNSYGASLFGIAAGGGIQAESRGRMLSDVSTYHEAGARWLRVDINWASIQAAGRHRFAWASTDRVVREAARCGMSVLGVIYYTPAWARPAGAPPDAAPNPVSYGRFAYEAARRYARLGVHAFEIWNEPNLSNSWWPAASPRAYTAVLKAAYRSIHAAQAGATVVVGGLAPGATSSGDVAPVRFLQRIYAYGGKGAFDAVGAHPYCWPAYPGARKAWSTWYQMYGTRTSLRSVMRSHGDAAKQIWATEFGAPTDGPAGSFVSQTTQAAMLTRAYRLWAGYTWAGPLFAFSGRDVGTDVATNYDFYGLLGYNYAAKPSFDAYWLLTHTV
jgi:hypothetical protein